jgi:hypothetical protein
MTFGLVGDLVLTGVLGLSAGQVVGTGGAAGGWCRGVVLRGISGERGRRTPTGRVSSAHLRAAVGHSCDQATRSRTIAARTAAR